MSVLSLFILHVNNSRQPPHLQQDLTKHGHVNCWKVPNLNPFHGTGWPCWLHCGRWWHTVVCGDYLAVCFWLPAAPGLIVDQFQALLTQFITWTPKTIQTGKTIQLSLEDNKQMILVVIVQTIPKWTTEEQMSLLRFWVQARSPRRALQDKVLEAILMPFLLTILSTTHECWKISSVVHHLRLMKLFLQEGKRDKLFWLALISRTDGQLYLSNFPNC